MSYSAPSVPAIIAESTITALTVIAQSATGAALPNSVLFTSGSVPFVLAPTPSSTAVSANISAPQASGTTKEGLPPKYAATSLPLAYPAPIIVPTLTVTAASTFFMVTLYYRSPPLLTARLKTRKKTIPAAKRAAGKAHWRRLNGTLGKSSRDKIDRAAPPDMKAAEKDRKRTARAGRNDP